MTMQPSAVASALNSQVGDNINLVPNFFERPENEYKTMTDIVGDALKEVLEPYWLGANSSTKKLKLDLSAAPLTLKMTFWEWIKLILEPQLNGELEGLEIVESYFQGARHFDMQSLDASSLTTIVLCYQLNAEGERIDGANDIEINVHWNRAMTQTCDVLLIEQLFTDMVSVDFTTERLEHYLALIGNPDE